jgi:hypothetical protein
VRVEDGRLTSREGRSRKFPESTSDILPCGDFAASKQPAYYVTERCVFRLTPEGLELAELRPALMSARYSSPYGISTDCEKPIADGFANFPTRDNGT